MKVSVPSVLEMKTDTHDQISAEIETRESHKMQALISKIGFEMNLDVWVPKPDKERVKIALEDSYKDKFLNKLPANFDESTNKTIENIDVLWVQRRSILNAFEVEHTTSIYSGLLRLGDLLAAQPNIMIKTHIVAPYEKKEKVKSQILRPIFSTLDGGPMYERCSFLSYKDLHDIIEIDHLSRMRSDILEDYEEYFED
ncbi:MAG: hypothetical protein ACON4W_05810 [Parvibaculales bacterium]